jgi:hypothetical protein
MSWCRWSSLDFRCDLYVYESMSGVEVHVAGGRYDLDYDLLPAAVSILDDQDAWRVRHDLLSALIADAETVAIDLPHARDSRTFDTLVEAACWIDELAGLGYVVPPGMTDEMRSSEETP